MKGEVSSWWLDHIESRVNQHLEEKGFRRDAIADNYTSQPPNDMGAVRKNAEIVQDCIDIDNVETTVLVERITTEVYEVIDDFMENINVALCIGVYSSDELQVKSLREDLGYLTRMKDMDEKIRVDRERGHLAPAALEMTDTVPIAGLVMARFHMMDCELRTVQDMWGFAKKKEAAIAAKQDSDSEDDDTSTYSSHNSLSESQSEWRMTYKNIGGKDSLQDFHSYFNAAASASPEAREGLAKRLGIGPGAMGFLQEASVEELGNSYSTWGGSRSNVKASASPENEGEGEGTDAGRYKVKRMGSSGTHVMKKLAGLRAPSGKREGQGKEPSPAQACSPPPMREGEKSPSPSGSDSRTFSTDSMGELALDEPLSHSESRGTNLKKSASGMAESGGDGHWKKETAEIVKSRSRQARKASREQFRLSIEVDPEGATSPTPASPGRAGPTIAPSKLTAESLGISVGAQGFLHSVSPSSPFAVSSVSKSPTKAHIIPRSPSLSPPRILDGPRHSTAFPDGKMSPPRAAAAATAVHSRSPPRQSTHTKSSPRSIPTGQPVPEDETRHLSTEFRDDMFSSSSSSSSKKSGKRKEKERSKISRSKSKNQKS